MRARAFHPEVEHAFFPACSGNAPFAGDDKCRPAYPICPAGTTAVWHFTRPSGSAAEWVPARDGLVCRAPATPGAPPAPAGPRPVAAPAPVLTPGLVLAAVRRLRLPAGRVRVQPPNGWTLANFDTNFYVRLPTQRPALTLLGQPVRLELRPARYRYVYGDGTDSGWTPDPGAPYPRLRVTHAYPRLARLTVRVDVAWAGQYAVGAGDWAPIPGTATTTGTPVPLTVREARAQLVAGDD